VNSWRLAPLKLTEFAVGRLISRRSGRRGGLCRGIFAVSRFRGVKKGARIYWVKFHHRCENWAPYSVGKVFISGFERQFVNKLTKGS